MKKKLIVFLLAIFTIYAMSIVAMAEDSTEYSGMCGPNVKWTLSEGVLTISGSGPMDDLDPEYGESQWNNWDIGQDITSIVISPGVTHIGDCAFKFCSITSITIPDSVTSIGKFAFDNCQSLKNVTLPEGLTDIGAYAFSDCKSLSSISIPYSVQHIGNGTFTLCSNLKSVIIPNNRTVLGDNDGKLFFGVTDVVISCNCDSNAAEHAYRYCIDTKLTHGTIVTVTNKATSTQNGSVVKQCSACKEEFSSSAIKYPKTISLSKTAFVYNGKVQKPTVTVKDSSGTTISASNYTVTYPSGMKNVGKYTVKVSFKGNYSGSKSLTYKINPLKTSIIAVKAKSKAFYVKWTKKITQVTGYEVQYSTSSTFKSGTKTVKVTSPKIITKTIKNLKGKKIYYIRIRTYKTVSGTKYYSAWSAIKKVKVK